MCACYAHNPVFFQFGEDHKQTRSSSELLRTITQQAVRVERNLRQAASDQIEQTVEVRHAALLSN